MNFFFPLIDTSWVCMDLSVWTPKPAKLNISPEKIQYAENCPFLYSLNALAIVFKMLAFKDKLRFP